jgi:PTH1 family peptidyl-tRNA hydrolase
MAYDGPAQGRVLIVGLGNPGDKYDGTRHNIGLDVAREFARRNRIAITESNFDAEVGSGVVEGRKVTVILPQTYMNRSGYSVSRAANFYKLGADSVVILHDDIDLPCGKIRLKAGGGHGGHNGLKSIDQQLSSRDYFRIRLGVGRPPEGGNVTSWVLGRFGKGEQDQYEDLLWDGSEAVERLLSDGLSEAQNAIHGR